MATTMVCLAKCSGAARVASRGLALHRGGAWRIRCAGSPAIAPRQAVIRPTSCRTRGATIATVGNATGQVVAKLVSREEAT